MEIDSVYSEVNYYVTLVMKKEDEVFAYRNYWNDMKAVQQEIPVGKLNYDQFNPGQVLSKKFDVGGLFKERAEAASYVVAVGGKRAETKYFVKYKNKSSAEGLSEYEFNKVTEVMKKEFPDRLNSYELFGRKVFTMLERELRTYRLKEVAGIIHQIAKLKIFNQSHLNTDFMKAYRNADLVHYIEVEIPDQKQIGFSTGVNTRNVFMTSHFSEMHGQVVSTRTVINPNLFYAKTEEGLVLVLNRAQLKDLGVVLGK